MVIVQFKNMPVRCLSTKIVLGLEQIPKCFCVHIIQSLQDLHSINLSEENFIVTCQFGFVPDSFLGVSFTGCRGTAPSIQSYRRVLPQVWVPWPAKVTRGLQLPSIKAWGQLEKHLVGATFVTCCYFLIRFMFMSRRCATSNSCVVIEIVEWYFLLL